MSVAHSFLPEFDHEMTNTRRVLERVVDDKWNWRPHPKSYTMGDLAAHVSNLPSWVTYTFKQDELELTDPSMAPRIRTNLAEAMTAFERNVVEARAALEAVSDPELGQEWRLLKGGHQILAMPKVAVYRTMVLNHLIHHRGQLTVYLRLNDIPVPGVYGPSADEK